MSSLFGFFLNKIFSPKFQQVLISEDGEKGASDGAVVDFRGNPVDKSKTGGWLGAGLILGALF